MGSNPAVNLPSIGFGQYSHGGFLNWMKAASSVLDQTHVWGGIPDSTGITYDSNLYPTALPGGRIATTNLFRVVTTPPFPHPKPWYPPGPIIVTWDGNPGAIVMESDAFGLFASDGPNRLKGTIPNASQTANGIRLDVVALPCTNIKIFEERYESRINAGEIYDPDWIALCKSFPGFHRYMDEPNVNFAYGIMGQLYPAVTDWWTNRPTLSYASWATPQDGEQLNKRRGMPIEAIVRLANDTMVPPYICGPHNADNVWWINTMTYVRDNMNPLLKALIEVANEAWNPLFNAFAYFNGDTQLYARRVVEVHNAIKDSVFSGDATKFHTVYGGHILQLDAAPAMVRAGMNQIYLGALVHTRISKLAVQVYVNDGPMPDIATMSVQDVIDRVTNQIAIDQFGDLAGITTYKNAIASEGWNVKLVAYEARAQLFDAAIGISGNPDPITGPGWAFKLVAAMRDPQSYGWTRTIMQKWNEGGGQEIGWYQMMDPYTAFAFNERALLFGMRELPTQPLTGALGAHSWRAATDPL